MNSVLSSEQLILLPSCRRSEINHSCLKGVKCFIYKLSLGGMALLTGLLKLRQRGYTGDTGGKTILGTIRRVEVEKVLKLHWVGEGETDSCSARR